MTGNAVCGPCGRNSAYGLSVKNSPILGSCGLKIHPQDKPKAVITTRSSPLRSLPRQRRLTPEERNARTTARAKSRLEAFKARFGNKGGR